MSLARLRQASFAEFVLLTEAIGFLAIARLAVVVLPFALVAALVRRPRGSPPDPAEQPSLIRQVAWSVGAAARRVPWRAMCLEQGIAAHWMLRRRSVLAVLHYGIARRDGDLLAHAWVRTGTVDVVGCENFADFAEVARFPAGA